MLDWLEEHQLPCLFKAIFGVRCPVCGFQTAILALLRGDWITSLNAWSPLLPLMVFLILATLRICGLKKITAGTLKSFGFVCLIIILISYLLQLSVNNI
ncbi:MAG: DUF2752 domain-containing protein [Odoribacter sp.]